MAVLIGTKGEFLGKRISLDDVSNFRIGRIHGDLTLESSNISRTHATIFQKENQYFIEDFSHNGTHVNHHRVSKNVPIPLNNGTKIRFCEHEFQFWTVDPTSSITAEEFSSTVELTLSVNREQPAKTLAWLLNLTTDLTKTLNIHETTGQVMDSLFDLFQKADRLLLFLKEGSKADGNLYLADSRTRYPDSDHSYSTTLLQVCRETGNGIVAENARKLGEELNAKSVILSGYRSVMCAPIQGRNDPFLGVIQLEVSSSYGKFNEEDLQLLMAVARQLAVSMEQAGDHAQLLEYEKVKRDLEVARQIQRGLLPQSPPTIPGYDLASYYEPAREVGGDYYDLIKLANGKIAILQGDVAGKGISASLFMARVSSAATYALRTENTLSAALTRLNDLVQSLSNFDRFVTLIIGVLDPKEHTVTLVNAGHARPLKHNSESGHVEELMPLDYVGLPLGLSEDGIYPEWTTKLGPRESLLFYSDGVPDCLNKDNVPFGMTGIYEAISQPNLKPPGMIEALLSAMETHSIGKEQFDDTTMVCFGRTMD